MPAFSSEFRHCYRNRNNSTSLHKYIHRSTYVIIHRSTDWFFNGFLEKKMKTPRSRVNKTEEDKPDLHRCPHSYLSLHPNIFFTKYITLIVLWNNGSEKMFTYLYLEDGWWFIQAISMCKIRIIGYEYILCTSFLLYRV